MPAHHPIPLQFVHRYLEDGSIEFICLHCFDVVCKVQLAGDAASFRDMHVCESENALAVGAQPRRRQRMPGGLFLVR
jgi:hypothetical protein